MISPSLLKDLQDKQTAARSRQLDLNEKARKAADHPFLCDQYSNESEYHRGRADAFDVVIRLVKGDL